VVKPWRSLFRALIARRAFEDGMTEELRFHMEQYRDDLERTGVPAEEAARRAQIEFGGVNSVKGECREARGLYWFDEVGRELRYAVRLLRKSPGFTATALVTLALCLGANLAIFAVIDAILLRPLPFRDAERLVTVFNTYPKAGVERDGSSLTNYYERRGRIPALASLSLYAEGTAIAGETGSTEREPIMRVSPEFFVTVGTGPAMGRAFSEGETTYGTDNSAILTDGYWRQHFNSDPHVIGKPIRLDGVAKAVVGVLPAGFRFLSSEARLYLPLASNPQDRLPRQRHSGGNVKQMIARLRTDATLAQAQAQIDAQNANLEADDPQAKMMSDAGFRSLVVPLHADHVASIRPTLLLLQGGVFLLLLIGAANLVNLLLIRASGRVKELAVRRALGASHGQVAGQVLVETIALALAGGILGLGVGLGGLRLLTALGADRLPLGAHIAFDGRLALGGLAGAIVLGLVLAAPIIWFYLREEVGGGLQSEARGGIAGRGAQTLRHSFIVAQIALAFVLLSGAGLLALSLKQALSVSPGFRAERVLTGLLSLPGKNYPDSAAQLAFIDRLMEEVGQQPGMISAGIVNNVPFSGRTGKSAATVKGHVARPGESARAHYSYGVGGNYFQALGFALQAGRFLTEADSRRGVRVCVVDQDFARYYWPKGNAIGGRVFEGGETRPDNEAFTVVGIVGSVKQAGLTDDSAQGAVYYPYMFRMDDHLYVAVRSRLAPELLGVTLQKMVRRIDSELPVTDLHSMDARIAESLNVRRSPAMLASLFAGIALLLTAIGTYGVLSYAVAQRHREIGVRMALGAQPGQIGWQFLSVALRLLAAGGLFGLAGAWWTGRAMQAVLFHVAALDWAPLTGAAGVIAVVALTACVLPARRAARISPMVALSEQ
jgi:predicted permease